MQHKFTMYMWLLLLWPILSHAEDTYERVYNILQTHCTNGCHTSATPNGMLVLNADPATVYNNLIGINPTNPAAQAKGYKRVAAGYADRSYLFKKINNGLEQNFDLLPDEGGAMPPYGALQLTNVEKELVRQWILFGAPQTGEVVSETLLEEFYASGGTFISPPPAPAAGQGFQLHHGPIFLQPQEEIEAFRKYDLQLPDSLDVIGFDIVMNAESHHFVVYQYHPTLSMDIPIGIRHSNGFVDEIVMYENADFLDIWQFGEPHLLPENAAFRWGPNTAIDLNYHIKNYSNVNIIPAEAYINFYTQPKDPGRKEMQIGIASYGGNNPFSLVIPNNGQETTFAFEQNTEDDQWVKLWKMQGHTHSRGRDFDVFLRNADGSYGTQLYEGFYNETHEFNQGYYDYAHPPVLRLQPTMCLNMKDGFVFRAKYLNDGPEPITFGLTTEGEMFAAYYHYINLLPEEVSECITGIDNLHANAFIGQWSIAPNPNNGTFNIALDLLKPTNLRAELFDILGRKVAQPYEGSLQQGQHLLPIVQNLSNGIYLLSLTTDTGTQTQQIVVK